MRAITISRFGEVDVLETAELAVPEPGGPGQVSIDVSHAAVGLADVLMRRGEFGGTPPIVPGLEVAGTVREVGAGVHHLRAGQPVVTLSRPTAGGYAEVSVPMRPSRSRSIPWTLASIRPRRWRWSRTPLRRCCRWNSWAMSVREARC